jgi:hypothetical protein
VATVHDTDRVEFDSLLREIIATLDADATAAGKTIVLHLVVEDLAGSSRKRLLSRRLEGDEEEGDADANAEANNEGQQKNGYYGYGYYNSYGEYVSDSLSITTLSICMTFSNSKKFLYLCRSHHTRPCSRSNTSTLSCGLQSGSR